MKLLTTRKSALQKKVSEVFGKLDILVNNAGIYSYKAFTEMSVEDWNKVLHINLGGTFNFTRTFIPQMIKYHYGKIVNIASVAGTFVAFPIWCIMAIAKLALWGSPKAKI